MREVSVEIGKNLYDTLRFLDCMHIMKYKF